MDGSSVVSLTPAAIQTMYRMNSSDDNNFFVPIVQVYRIKKNVRSSNEIWSIALSDGQYYINGLCHHTLVNLIHSHDIAQNSIIRIHKFQITTRKYRGRFMKVVTLTEAEKAAPNPGYPIGTPVNIEKDDRNESEESGRNDSEESVLVDFSAVMAEVNDGPRAETSREAFFPTTEKGNWQDDYRDFHHRRDMVKTVIRLLSEDIPRETYEITTPAKQIELALYQQAPTFDAYIEMSTLRDRVKRLETSIHMLNAASKPIRYL